MAYHIVQNCQLKDMKPVIKSTCVSGELHAWGCDRPIMAACQQGRHGDLLRDQRGRAGPDYDCRIMDVTHMDNTTGDLRLGRDFFSFHFYFVLLHHVIKDSCSDGVFSNEY